MVILMQDVKVEKRTGYDWHYLAKSVDNGEIVSGIVFGTGPQIQIDQIYTDSGLNCEEMDILLVVRSDYVRFVDSNALAFAFG
jgi:hypothetical protein